VCAAKCSECTCAGVCCKGERMRTSIRYPLQQPPRLVRVYAATTVNSSKATCSTRDSTVVPLRSTDRAQWSLPSKFEMGLGARSYAMAACDEVSVSASTKTKCHRAWRAPQIVVPPLSQCKQSTNAARFHIRQRNRHELTLRHDCMARTG
jgi:hypothetical protein